jgi:hypothetical protein
MTMMMIFRSTIMVMTVKMTTMALGAWQREAAMAYDRAVRVSYPTRNVLNFPDSQARDSEQVR